MGAATRASQQVRGQHQLHAGLAYRPGAAMIVNNFTTNAGSSPTLNPAAGVLNFSVGADLVVKARQAASTHRGTYTLTVIYWMPLRSSLYTASRRPD